MSTLNLKSEISKASNIFNAGKSLAVKKSLDILKSAGYNVVFDSFKGYKDTKIAGNRFVTSRKEVNYWKVEVRKNDSLLATFNSETTSHTAYSLTAFVLNNVKY